MGVIGAITSLFLALRKRVAEEDVPALRRRVEDLEKLREGDRREYERRIAEVEQARENDRAEYQQEIRECRAEVLTLDRRYFEFERFVVREGVTVPENLRRLAPRSGPFLAGPGEPPSARAAGHGSGPESAPDA